MYTAFIGKLVVDQYLPCAIHIQCSAISYVANNYYRMHFVDHAVQGELWKQTKNKTPAKNSGFCRLP